MALMAVKIENEASLMMNEFFDYNGTCWAVTAERSGRKKECTCLEDFYECTVQTEWLEDVPVLFVVEGQVAGWYRSAKIYRNRQIISAFLEGNVCARTLDVRLLARDSRIPCPEINFEHQMYAVIEQDDERYGHLTAMMEGKKHFIEIRYDLVQSFYSGDRVRMAGASQVNSRAAVKQMRDYCIEKCGEYAGKVMSDQCRDIRELKTMYHYAKAALKYDSKCVDGLYYLAMACEQLGFVKEGFKAIEKALLMEPDGDDLLALKGHLLFSSGKYEAAAQKYQEAYEIQPLDGYLMCTGQAWFALGNVDQAYKAYQKVSDKKLLEDSGINLKDMERRWPFVALRGFSLKDFFGRKHS